MSEVPQPRRYARRSTSVKSRFVVIRLTETELVKLGRLARRAGRTRAAFVREKLGFVA